MTGRRISTIVAVIVALALLIGLAVALGGPDPDDGPGTTQTPLPGVTPSTPRGTPTSDVPATVRLEVGDDFQAAVDANAPGSTFIIASGLHREQKVIPRDRDTFIGEPGAIMSGARDVTDADWKLEEGFWVIDGQTQQFDVVGQQNGGRARDWYPEELFVDGERVLHVSAFKNLRPGTWFFERGKDRIWIGDDPATLGLIETSAQDFAFEGEYVADVTIANLVVERYANRTSRGAINGHNTTRWTIRFCETRYNHGGGIGMGPGMVVEHCDTHHNGQIGVVGQAAYRQGPSEGESIPYTMRTTNIHDNRELTIPWAFEGGGTKFTNCFTGMLFEQNWVHDNNGPGQWVDVDCIGAVIRGNLVENNTVFGIFYEISFGPALIENNIVRANGSPSEDAPGAGIFVSNSPDTTVRDNWVVDQDHAILAIDRDRGASAVGGPRVVQNLLVENNVLESRTSTGILVPDGVHVEAFDVTSNRFVANRYVTVPGPPRFAWEDRELSFADWQALGQDVDAVLLDERPEQPTGPQWFRFQHYGPLDDITTLLDDPRGAPAPS